ncbi:MAG: spore germination protein [Vallitaleaceae bacterium]|nr:spore germination protein [Vallitaleaceae bacterium]
MERTNGKFKARIDALISDNQDISKRIIRGCSGEVCLLFIKQLTDREKLSNHIIQPIMRYITRENSRITPTLAINSIILAEDCVIEENEELIEEYLLDGMTLILFSEYDAYIVAEIKLVASKSIEGPELTFTLKGARDSFIENLNTNLSLIRYRIKDPHLKVCHYKIGRRTKTGVAIVYIEDIVNDAVVNELKKRIVRIDTDGIAVSGELELLLASNKRNLFPEVGIIESSDVACGALLEGKVIIFAEGSGIALVVPKVFCEFIWSSEDNYDNPFFGLFSKVLRLLAVLFSISLSALFIIVTSFSYDLLPAEYITILSVSRANVPFNALTGVLLLEGMIELLRESLLRVPKQIGSAVGIVGAIIIGQAAISSGIFSPLLLILVSLSFLSSFVFPDFTIMNALRLMKFLLIILSGFLGIFGFVFGLFFIMTKLISSNSFGIPYLAPFAPYNKEDVKKVFFNSKAMSKKRPHFLRTKNQKRSK